MLNYSQKTGLLSQDGVALGYGYAGRGKGLNNPDGRVASQSGLTEEAMAASDWEVVELD